MPPWHNDVIQATVFFIDPKFLPVLIIRETYSLCDVDKTPFASYCLYPIQMFTGKLKMINSHEIITLFRFHCIYKSSFKASFLHIKKTRHFFFVQKLTFYSTYPVYFCFWPCTIQLQYFIQKRKERTAMLHVQ